MIEYTRAQTKESYDERFSNLDEVIQMKKEALLAMQRPKRHTNAQTRESLFI
jgi:hypothetical protein